MGTKCSGKIHGRTEAAQSKTGLLFLRILMGINETSHTYGAMRGGKKLKALRTIQALQTTHEIEAFFSADPYVIPLYQSLESLLFALGEVTRKVQKTQISFSSGKGFAYVWLPIHKVKGRPEHYFILSFSLDHQVVSPRIVEDVEPYPGRWMHHLILSAQEELDEELLDWLRKAYNFGLR